MKLEKFLNNRFDVKFEVYYVNRKDENTLRSLERFPRFNIRWNKNSWHADS